MRKGGAHSGLVYYFDADGNEIGYTLWEGTPDEAVKVWTPTRVWSPEFLGRLVIKKLQPSMV